MKALELMTPADKAWLLADLHPGHVEPILNHTLDYCSWFTGNADAIKTYWTTTDVSFEQWYRMVCDLFQVIRNKIPAYAADHRQFANALFQPEFSPVMIASLIRYTSGFDAQYPFRKTVHLLFPAQILNPL